MKARTLKSTTLAVLGALVGVLALNGAAADGEVTHAHLSQITEVPTSSGAAFTGTLAGANAMTVESGELYVSEGNYNHPARINKFDASTGAFIAQLPHLVKPEDLWQGVAVDHASGELYVGADERVEELPLGAVGVLDPAGNLQATWQGSDTPELGFGCVVNCGAQGDVAIDNSTSLGDWAAGDVYVTAPSFGVVDVFKPTAKGGETYVTQITGTGPGEPFAGALLGVTVDSTGRVLVLEGNGVDIFEPTALNEYAFVERLSETPFGPFEGIGSVAVDGGNGDIYISAAPAYPASPVVYQFNSAGVYQGRILLETVSGLEGSLGTLAVDSSTHDLYVASGRNGNPVVARFGPSIVVPDVTTTGSTNVKATSVTLEGTVNPDNGGVATCQFQYGTTTSFGSFAPCSAAVPDGGSPVAVQAQLSGLQTDTTYHYRLQATNANGTNLGEGSQNLEVTTPGPGIHQESSSLVAATSATLNASIDPDNAATSYYFQYGTTAAYGTDVPAAPGLPLGSGAGDLPVSVHLQGLAPATTYHYRVVAVSEPGGEAISVQGPDETFTTQTTNAALTLPDGRQWEMVTPPNKQGAGIYAIGFEVGDDIQAAEDGSGITFGASAPFTESPAGSEQPEIAQVISTRKAPGSWESQDISTEHNEGGAGGIALAHRAEYKVFSTDLSQAFVEPKGNTPLPPLPAGSEKTVYLRNNANGAFTALVTAANVPAGTHFGGDEKSSAEFAFDLATPDLRHVVLNTKIPLTSAPLSECGVSVIWAAGTLSCSGGRVSSTRHGISDDGSRVIGPEFFGHVGLDLRDLTKGETVQVNAAQGTPEPVETGASYDTASNDGARVFFQSPQRLTADSTATPSGNLNDLYVYEVTSAAAAPLAGQLTDLTVDANEGESAGVEGVIGASDDGSYVYFAATGVLGDGAELGAVVKGNNLYVAHHDEATHSWNAPHFIAALSSEDFPSWQDLPRIQTLTSRVSPNGRFVTFMSERGLTGYETADANSGVPDEEVYLYDASTGRLVCASCNPTGARPAGLYVGTGYDERLIDYTQNLWQGRWLAGSIPGWNARENVFGSDHQPRYLSDSGRMYFDSSDAIVPADVNGKADVYQYEPAGVGDCQAPDYGQSGSVVFSEAIDGCIGLISAGTSSGESAFMDASETGGDVFFLTLSKLSQKDVDTSLDVYDAHVCAASAPCAPPEAASPPPCASGDACKPAPTPQPGIFGAPPSQTFSGAGNVVPSASKSIVKPRPTTQKQKLAKALKACRKKPRRVRGACERRARKRYAAKRARTGKSLSARTRR